MKILSLKNRHIGSSFLIILSLIFYLSQYYLRHLFSIFPINYLLSIFVFLPAFSIIPLFYMVVKYEFKDYSVSALILLLGVVFFLKYKVIYLLFYLIFPALIFKLMFKNFKLKSFTSLYYSLLTYSLSLTILAIVLLQTNSFSNILQNAIEKINEVFNSILVNLQNKNISASDLVSLEKWKALIIYRLKNYYPSIIFYFSSAFITINFFFGIFYINLFKFIYSFVFFLF